VAQMRKRVRKKDRWYWHKVLALLTLLMIATSSAVAVIMINYADDRRTAAEDQSQ
jgi:hypothetical protein